MKRAFNCEQRSTEAHLAIEQSLQGLQQREAEMFHHKTFRPKVLSSRRCATWITIRAAHSRDIFASPLLLS